MSPSPSLEWRYAVKTYDASRRVGEDDIAYLKSAIRLAPSSYGLQPYRVLFVEDAAVRAELRAASYGQSQITNASHLVVFATEEVLDEGYVRRLFVGQPPARIDHAHAALARMGAAETKAWAVRQAYLALGFLLYSAAERRIDANPMEGFVPRRYDAILGLEGVASTAVIAALGFRSPDDRYQHAPKLRRPVEELFPGSGR